MGRDREIAEVKGQLSAQRLLTLTGPGGCGKTRLALQVAAGLLGEFEDGIWFVEFAPLADPLFVPQALASILGVSEGPGRALTEALADHFLHLHSLVVLDNCEHLIGACAQLADSLLKACPDLSILATSCEILNISGEAVFVVPPLSLPGLAEATVGQPQHGPAGGQGALPAYDGSEAVRLFVERAAMVSPSFELTPENGLLIAEICRRLDGMPLAIELAAARVRALSLQQIAVLLDDRFHLLTGGSRTAPLRHQTLAAALDWSYALLSQVEQKVLQRLSVFAGGWTLDAAEAVCAGDGVEAAEVLDVLSHLIDKSLVAARGQGAELRYHLLETIRQYARQKLVGSGLDSETQDKHLGYYVEWAETALPHLNGAEKTVWLVRFESEHDNLRASLGWSQVSMDAQEAGLRLANATVPFWVQHGYYTEGRTWLAAMLAQKGIPQRSIDSAQALLHAGTLAFYQSDYGEVRRLAEQSLAISRELDAVGRPVVADALELLAEVATETGNYPAAPGLYEQALSLYKELGDQVGIGDTLKMLGWGAMRLGNYAEAETRLEEGLVACRQSGDLRQITSALAGLGELALRRGRYERAGAFLRESSGYQPAFRRQMGDSDCARLAGLGGVAPG